MQKSKVKEGNQGDEAIVGEQIIYFLADGSPILMTLLYESPGYLTHLPSPYELREKSTNTDQWANHSKFGLEI